MFLKGQLWQKRILTRETGKCDNYSVLIYTKDVGGITMYKNLEKSAKEKRKVLNVLMTFLLIAILVADVALLGQYFNRTKHTYATEPTLMNQDSRTNVENVKFGVYLETDNVGQNIIEKDINSEDLIVYAYVKVEGGGALREAEISFGETNFKLRQGTESGTFSLDTIQSGQDVLIEIPVDTVIQKGKFNLGLLDMISTIKLTGKYTNNDGNVEEVYSEKNVQIIWNSSAATEESELAFLNQEIITNGIFEINGQNKRVIQILVNSGVEGNVYPIKETNIEIDVPKLMDIEGPVIAEEELPAEENLGEEELIAEEETEIVGEPEETTTVAVLPETVRVAVINGTNATNGKTGIVELGEVNTQELKPNSWSYDSENGRVNIKSMNIPDGKNNVSWKKTGMDEYIITYVYSEDVDISNITSDIRSTILLYGNNELELSAENSMIQEEPSELSNIVSFNVLVTDKVYKSNMNVSENIEYKGKWEIGISYSDAIDSIIVMGNKDIIMDKSETVGYERSIYKATKINKEEFIKLFGEDGFIGIYNVEEEQLIYVINKETEADENGDIEITYEEGIYDIFIKTSRPVKEGKLNVENTKEIITQGFSDEEIFGIDKLKSTANVAGVKGEEVVEEKTKDAYMKFIDLVTLARLRIE